MSKLTKNDSKDKTLDQVLQDIEKQFGKGAIMKLGEDGVKDIDVISSGSLMLDVALGVGGYPKGRIIEIYGPESSGKTTFALHAIAEVQKTGGRAAFIDAEHALDPVYAKNLGVNINELLLSQPDTGEISLSELAGKFFLNPYYLSQMFRKKTGMTYQSYVTSLRVERAKELFGEKDYKVYEVCEMVGYSDTAYFSRVFERATGCKPSEYRKLIYGGQ